MTEQQKIEEFKRLAKEKEFFDKVSGTNLSFAEAREALNLVDLTKTQSRTFSTFSKDKLRGYLQNPLANKENLRNLSKFLYRRSYQYRRLIKHNASMVDLKAAMIIPLANITKEESESKVLKRYQEAVALVERMGLQDEIFKILITAWIEDCAFAYVYDSDNEFFLHLLDGEFCRISSIENGIFNFAFNFSYFRGKDYELEHWAPEFKEKFTAYQRDTRLMWQELDPLKTMCIKINNEDPTMPLPPFVSLFEQIIDLTDLQTIQSVKDELSIYKLLVARLETLTGAKEANQWEVDITTAIEYYNRMAGELPEAVSAILSPVKIDAIEFKGNTTEDVDMVSAAMRNLFSNSGGSQVLNNPNLTGSSGYEAANICDSEMGLSSVLPQIERWTNRYVRNILGDELIKIHYMEVTPYTKAAKKKSLLESAQNGIPTKLAVPALDGFSTLETLSLQYLENSVLKLQDEWVPLSTSYTMSGTNGSDPITGGAPTKDDKTAEGEATAEGDKNNI